MIILPAIDIKDGNCVRLIKGNFATVHKVAKDPVKTALRFKEAGAEWIHMVDLDGAKNATLQNKKIFIDVAQKSGLKVELGGGIRDMKAADYYLSNGLSRIILGSAAVNNPSFVKQAVAEFGDKIAVGIDARNGKVAAEGWLDTSDIDYIDLAKAMEQVGVKYIIFTDISKDGTLTGPNFNQLQAISSAVSCHIIASGGIANIADISALCDMNLYGAICGKSIYQGTLDLKAAIKAGGENQ